MSFVVQIAGKKGAGKTTLASNLEYLFINDGFTVGRFSFATPIKRILFVLGVSKVERPHSIYEKYRNFFTEYSFKKAVNYWFDDFSKIAVKYISNVVLDIDNFLMYMKKYQNSGDLLNNNRLVAGLQYYYLHKRYDEGCRLLMQSVGSILRAYDEDIFVKIAKNKIENANTDVIIIDDLRFPNEAFKNAFKIRINNSDKNNDMHESEIYVDEIDVDLDVMRHNSEYNPSLRNIYLRIRECLVTSL